MASSGSEKIHTSKAEVRGLPRALSHFWLRIWRGNPPGVVLASLAFVTGFLMFLPIIYVIVRGLQGGKDRWLRLLDTRIPILLQNTLSLTLIVTIFAIIIGVSLAWLVIRTDLPGKKIWVWLLALPLVIPPYVGAITYIIIFGPTGWVRDWLGSPLFNMYF